MGMSNVLKHRHFHLFGQFVIIDLIRTVCFVKDLQYVTNKRKKRILTDACNLQSKKKCFDWKEPLGIESVSRNAFCNGKLLQITAAAWNHWLHLEETYPLIVSPSEFLENFPSKRFLPLVLIDCDRKVISD